MAKKVLYPGQLFGKNQKSSKRAKDVYLQCCKQGKSGFICVFKHAWQLLQNEPKSRQNGKNIAKNTRFRQIWPNRIYGQGSSSKRAKKAPKWTKDSKYGKKSLERTKNHQKVPKMFTCNAAPRAEVVSFVSLNMPGSSSQKSPKWQKYCQKYRI